MPTAIKTRTYTCGSCGGEGHNKKTCPESGVAPAPPAAPVAATPAKKRRVIASKDSPKVLKFPKADKKAKKVKKVKPTPPKAAVSPKPPKADVSAKPPLKKLKKAKATPAVLCLHSKIESFQDEGGGGIFSECSICNSRGPLKKTQKAAVAALKEVKAVRPHNQGGAREGSGVRKKLDGTDKMRGYVLEDKHVEIIKKFSALCLENGGDGKYSSSMRRLLVGLTEKDLKRLAKDPK